MGARGEKVSDYPQVMIRLPRETKEVLDALSGLTGTPIWRLIDESVRVYVDQLSESERRLLTSVQRRRATKRDGNNTRSGV
jgi:predicted DNA-binding protein